MNKIFDPKIFGLHSTTKLEKAEDDLFFIVIDRKSRIIMKDGKNILDKAKKIRDVVPHAQVAVKTNTPICSKTRNLLESNGIWIQKR